MWSIHEHTISFPKAEFHFFCDPHAAYIVFHSGIPILLLLLDVTYLVALKREHIDNLLGIYSPISQFVDDATRLSRGTLKKYQGINGLVMNDPLSLMC
jgi:purine nucleosidase